MRVLAILVMGFAATLSACASTGSHTYKLYPGPSLPASELASVEFGSRITNVAIDGLAVDRSEYGTVLLLPGEHSIEFINYNGSVYLHYVALLERGHTYQLVGTDVWPFCCPDDVSVSGQKVSAWIKDADSGEVVGEIFSP